MAENTTLNFVTIHNFISMRGGTILRPYMSPKQLPKPTLI